MKIRAGFVSNSSSSSFLLIGDAPLDSSEALVKWMSPNIPSRWVNDDGDEEEEEFGYSDHDVASYLMENSRSPVELSLLLLRLTSEAWYQTNGYGKPNSEERSKAASLAGQKQLADLLKNNKNHFLWISSIEDHGNYGDVESGERFPNKIKFSEH